MKVLIYLFLFSRDGCDEQEMLVFSACMFTSECSNDKRRLLLYRMDERRKEGSLWNTTWFDTWRASDLP